MNRIKSKCLSLVMEIEFDQAEAHDTQKMAHARQKEGISNYVELRHDL